MNATAPRLDMAPAHWVIVQDILRRLAPEHEVWVFGSRATGRAKPYSDLDLMLLHDTMPDEAVTEVAEGLWYPLWDANIRLHYIK